MTKSRLNFHDKGNKCTHYEIAGAITYERELLVNSSEANLQYFRGNYFEKQPEKRSISIVRGRAITEEVQ